MRLPAGSKPVEHRLARLEALRTELKRMVHERSGGQTADCRVLEVLRDHPECPTNHEEIMAKMPVAFVHPIAALCRAAWGVTALRVKETDTVVQLA